MKIKGLGVLLFTILLSCLVSCGNNGKSDKSVKTGFLVNLVEKTDSCKSNPKNAYEIYIPERAAFSKQLPLVIIIDPHGDGKFAVNKFKAGADKYSVILVASNYLKNGFENFEEAINVLIKDVHEKYPVNKATVLAGFSGGARMALGYAQHHPVNGLIMCGALANAAQITAVNCPVFAISGTDDFNFVETAQYLFQDQLIPENLKIELTNSSHNWPDSLILTDAMGFLRFSLIPANIQTTGELSIADYCDLQKARIDSMKKQGDYLKAALIARNLSTTALFNADKSFNPVYAGLKAEKDYKSQLDKLGKSLKFELDMRQPYLEAFTKKDSLWWKKEIDSVNDQIESEKDPITKDMYQRIKGFWGIACYSLGNQAIKEKDAVSLKKIVTIYRMLEPENPYGIYFSAFPYFWKGDTKTTISILKNAREAGFSDLNLLKTDFPAAVLSKIE